MAQKVILILIGLLIALSNAMDEEKSIVTFEYRGGANLRPAIVTGNLPFTHSISHKGKFDDYTVSCPENLPFSCYDSAGHFGCAEHFENVPEGEDEFKVNYVNSILCTKGCAIPNPVFANGIITCQKLGKDALYIDKNLFDGLLLVMQEGNLKPEKDTSAKVNCEVTSVKEHQEKDSTKYYVYVPEPYVTEKEIKHKFKPFESQQTVTFNKNIKYKIQCFFNFKPEVNPVKIIQPRIPKVPRGRRNEQENESSMFARVIILLLVVGVLGVGGYYWYFYCNQDAEATDDYNTNESAGPGIV